MNYQIIANISNSKLVSLPTEPFLPLSCLLKHKVYRFHNFDQKLCQSPNYHRSSNILPFLPCILASSSWEWIYWVFQRFKPWLLKLVRHSLAYFHFQGFSYRISLWIYLGLCQLILHHFEHGKKLGIIWCNLGKNRSQTLQRRLICRSFWLLMENLGLFKD